MNQDPMGHNKKHYPVSEWELSDRAIKHVLSLLDKQSIHVDALEHELKTTRLEVNLLQDFYKQK